tara:strand:+ start:15891 stop:16487 length:597 start_codon:yes stop_codon:yes gene_type:complete
LAASPKKKQDTAPLNAEAWSEAALDLLATHGIDGVRIEPLAKRLSVTKGSFYWHFKDRNALHEKMLADWCRHTTLSLIERLDHNVSSPRLRLRKLLRLPLLGKRSQHAADVELAIRLWGRRDERARKALQEVDGHRLSYIEKLLAECGVPAGECAARAVLAYSYLRVAATLVAADATALMDTCEDLLIGPAASLFPQE